MIWALALAGFVLSGMGFVAALDAGASAERLEGHAVRLGRELNEMSQADGALPTEAEFAALAARIERLNALSGPRNPALPAILEALEAALPPSVWVSQLNYSVETGSFAVSLLGESETDLPAALRRIEAVPVLSDVILERQVRVQRGARNLLQYDIRATAR